SGQLMFIGMQVGWLPDRTEEYYLDFSFGEATAILNGLGKTRQVNVALYDEPRGYYLDVDYWWANPGHSRLIEYEKLANGEDLVRELKRLGTTHLYWNLQFADMVERERIQRALAGEVVLILQYKKLIVDAYRRKL